MTECYCGVCRPCRLAERLIGRGTTQPVTLSEKARAILAEPVGTEYVQPKVSKVITPTPRKSRALTRPTITYTGTCTQCEQPRGTRQIGRSPHGVKVAGTDGMCEVCADNRKIQARLDAGEGHRVIRAIWRIQLRRVLRDGRAYHPDANHGTNNGYARYGCRCDVCATWKTANNRKYRKPKVTT